MLSFPLRAAYRLSRALSFRLERYKEWRDLVAQGRRFPKGMVGRILRAPHDAADFIDLAAFIDPAQPVTLIDVGANVGKFASEFRQFFPQTTICAFEPVPSTFEKLKANVNGGAVLHQLALSDAAETRQIWFDSDDTLCSLEQYREEVNRHYGMSYRKRVEIETARLDDVALPKFQGQVVLKVDVQGHEVPMLRGAVETIKGVDLVIAELAFTWEYRGRAPSFPIVCALLATAGLYPIIFQDYGRSQSNYAFERDVIFVREHLLDRIWRHAEA